MGWRFRPAWFFVVAAMLGGCCGIVVAQDFSQRGPYAVGYRMIEKVRPSGSLCQMYAYYPATKAGRNQPLDAEEGPHPLVLFNSPVVPMVFYTDTLAHLASWGFVVVAPVNGLFLWPDELAIARDLAFCRDYMAAENRRPASPFFENVNSDRYAYTGHSWGGSCAIIAGTEADDRLKVVVAWSLWPNSQPKPVDQVTRLGCPLLLFNGSNDTNIPLQKVRDVYRAGNPSKALFVLCEGSHQVFYDDKFWWTESAGIQHRVLLGSARHYLTAAVLLYLRDEDSLWPLLWDPLTQSRDHVLYEWDSGIEWESHPVTISGAPGEEVEVSLFLKNNTQKTQRFELQADDGQGEIVITPGVTEELSPAARAPILLKVKLPEGTPQSLKSISVSARSQADEHTRGVTHIIPFVTRDD